MTQEAGDEFLGFIRAYANDPVAFVRNVLGADPLPWQVDFLNNLARGERRISVRAGDVTLQPEVVHRLIRPSRNASLGTMHSASMARSCSGALASIGAFPDSCFPPHLLLQLESAEAGGASRSLACCSIARCA